MILPVNRAERRTIEDFIIAQGADEPDAMSGVDTFYFYL